MLKIPQQNSIESAETCVTYVTTFV